jgi:hypothetical protein
MFAKLTQFSNNSKSSAPAETLGKAGLLTSASPLGYGGNDQNAPLSPYPIIFAAYAPPGGGDAEVAADAMVAPNAASPITPGEVFSGSPLDKDQTLIQATGNDGPYVSGAKWREKEYSTQAVLLGNTRPGTVPTSQFSPNPKAPYTQYFIKSYGKYLLAYDDTAIGKAYCVSNPYALTFTYEDDPNDPYKIAVKEKQAISTGGNVRSYNQQGEPEIEWPDEPQVADWTTIYPNEAIPLAPRDQGVSYGYLKANPKMKQVVLTDAPGFDGVLPASVRESF